PLFPYATRLTEVVGASLSFDREKTYIQTGDRVGLYLPATQSYLYATAVSLTPTGCVIDEELPVDERWEIMPALQVRLPNLSAISMEALTGEYSIAGEQAAPRQFLREGS